MRKIVVIASDPIEEYIRLGKTYKYLNNYFNPGGYFNEVYCLSPWMSGMKTEEGVVYIGAKPKQFSKLIKEIKPDVVRAYDGFKCSDWVCASRVCGIPIVVSVHDTNPELIYSSVKYADKVVCMTQAVKDAVLTKVSVDENHMFILPNRVNVDLFSHKDELKKIDDLNKLYGEGFHVLHVGRKSEQKNLDTVIKALTYLPDNYKVLFLGQGDEDEYKKLAYTLKVDSKCYFVKTVMHDELPYYYSWCDCMCTPSRWEGFGFVFIEAAACESLIITSNIAPMNEFLTNNYNAILVDDYENPEIIAKAIEQACEENENRKFIKHNARDVGLKFEKSKIDECEIKMYIEVIENGTSAKPNYLLRVKVIYFLVLKNKVKRLILRISTRLRQAIRKMNYWRKSNAI